MAAAEPGLAEIHFVILMRPASCQIVTQEQQPGLGSGTGSGVGGGSMITEGPPLD